MKKLSVLCAAVLVAICAFAEKGAVILTSPLQLQVNAVSPNGKWACGIIGDGNITILQGMLWNLETGETTYLSTTDESYAYDVTDDGLVVGAYTDYEITGTGLGAMVAGYYHNGKWTHLENNTIEGVNELGGEVFAVSADGRVMVGYVQNGPKDSNIAPARWEDGKLVAVLPYVGAGVAYTVSEDGKYVSGWAYKEGDFNRNIALWRDNETVEYLSPSSSFAEAGRKLSADGTKLVCNSFGHKFIYDLTTGDKTELPWISPACWGQEMSYISNDGLVLGGEESQDPTTGASGRYGYVFDGGKAYDLNTWMKNLYNFEIDTQEHMVFRGVDMSADGKVIALLDYPLLNGIPLGDHASIIVKLDQEITYCAPVALAAEKLTGLNSVRLTWKAPLSNAENVLGFNVYRNGVAIAESISEYAMIDANVEFGTYTYTVTALYLGENDEIVESEPCHAADVEVAADKLNTVVNIETHPVNYNDLKLRWNAPLSNLPSLTYFDYNQSVAGFGGGLVSFSAAIRLPYDVVENYSEHYKVARISFMPRNAEAVYTVKVLVNDVEKSSKRVAASELTLGTMNTIDLDVPVAYTALDDVIIAVDVDASQFSMPSNDVIGMNYGSNVITGFSDLLRQASEPEYYSLNQSSIDAGYGEMPISWAIEAIFAKTNADGSADISSEIIEGYTVYRNGEMVGTTESETFIDTNLTEGTYTYGVVANYQGQSSEAATKEVRFTPKTEALVAVTPSTVWADVTFFEVMWDAPLNNDATVISYSNGISSGRGINLSGANLFDFTAAHDYPYSYLKWYEGYTIDALRFFPTAEATFAIVLEVNGIDHEMIVLGEMGAEDGYTLNTWNSIRLTEPVKIQSGSNYRVKLLCVDVTPNNYPICMDTGVGTIGVSDLYSFDYESFSSVISDAGLTGSWMLGMDIHNDNTELLPVAGYNVIFDGAQANTELVTDTYFRQDGLSLKNNSTHRVKINTIYNIGGTTIEVEGNQVVFNALDGVESIEIDRVKVYPNPATSYIKVEGAVERLAMVDMAGRTVAETTANTIDVTSLPVGNYILNVYEGGEVRSVKVLVVR